MDWFRELDIALSAGAAALLAAIAVLCLAGDRKLPLLRFAALLSISLIAILANHSPLDAAIPEPVRSATWLIASGNTLFTTWFGLSVFDDRFRLDKRMLTVGALWYAVNAPASLQTAGHDLLLPEAWFQMTDLFALALMGYMVWTAIAGREDDLVEARRRARRPFVLAIAATITVIVLAENSSNEPEMLVAIALFRGVATLSIAFIALIWLARLDPAPLVAAPRIRDSSGQADKARDHIERDRLLACMREDAPWRDAALTIGTLAAHLRMPEHRLRKLINRSLGHRNFSSFLHDYRLEAVKQDLADPDKAHLPILTIAMDAGYGSLAPFNRAFRERTTLTPTAWREKALTRHRQASV